MNTLLGAIVLLSPTIIVITFVISIGIYDMLYETSLDPGLYKYF
jgi:hypothetical protein